MRFEFILNHEHEFDIIRMCRILEVKTSSYYAWRKRPVSKREQENIKLQDEIKVIFEINEGRYGSPRVFKDLIKSGKLCSLKRVARLMRKNNLVSKIKRRKFKNKMGSVPEDEACPNIVNRNFTPDKPNQIFVTDITYIESEIGWIYLCVFIDLFSRKVVGWSVSDNMKTAMVLEALAMACRNRLPEKGLVIHSDQGSQYGSKEYKSFLERHGFVQSMSRRGNCWDNACAETFFKTLKIEELNDLKIKDVKELKWILFKYIEVYYNKKRLHSTLEYVSPENYEKIFIA